MRNLVVLPGCQAPQVSESWINGRCGVPTCPISVRLQDGLLVWHQVQQHATGTEQLWDMHATRAAGIQMLVYNFSHATLGGGQWA